MQNDTMYHLGESAACRGYSREVMQMCMNCDDDKWTEYAKERESMEKK